LYGHQLNVEQHVFRYKKKSLCMYTFDAYIILFRIVFFQLSYCYCTATWYTHLNGFFFNFIFRLLKLFRQVFFLCFVFVCVYIYMCVCVCCCRCCCLCFCLFVKIQKTTFLIYTFKWHGNNCIKSFSTILNAFYSSKHTF
jgi:hypothetical protein